jgi:hypothetical protein
MFYFKLRIDLMSFLKLQKPSDFFSKFKPGLSVRLGFCTFINDLDF